jgi:TrwC relaxase
VSKNLVLSIRSISHAGGYRNYLEKEGIGEWIGDGAELLDLTGEVTKEEFDAIRQGIHPQTAEQLRAWAMPDRVYRKTWGDETYRAREMFDLVLSAPKSVSVQGLVDGRMREAHAAAADATRREMETLVGPMVIAAYQHETSRKLDPQIHSHLVAGNLSYDGERWHALGANAIYRSQAELTESYRQKLTETLRGWGYEIDYPELKQVAQELCDKFSQRSAERELAIQKYAREQSLTVRPTNREVAILVRDHREKKQVLPPQQIRDLQLARLTPDERTQLITVRDRALEHSYDIDMRYKAEPYRMAPQQQLAGENGAATDQKPEPKEEAGERLRSYLRDDKYFEPGLHHESWNYGQKNQGRKMGF